MTDRLTMAILKSVDVPDTGYVYAWDGDVKGFGARLSKAKNKDGRTEVRIRFVARYRLGRRQKVMTIGTPDVFPVPEARKHAAKMIAKAQQDEDPMARRRELKAAKSMNQLFDRYLERHAAMKKASGYRTDKQRIDSVLRKAFGRMLVADVSRDDVLDWYRGMRDTPYQANRSLALLKTAFNLAERWEYRAENSNPCKVIGRAERYAERARDVDLTDVEISALAQAMHQAGDSKAVNRAITLLLLTGLRCSELLGRKLDRKRVARGIYHIDDNKTGGYDVTLSDAAAFILLDVSDDCQWAAPNDDGGPLTYRQLDHQWRKVRKHAGLDHVRLHDLRHTCFTIAGNSGFNAFVVKNFTKHKTMAMVSRYVGDRQDPTRQLANRVADQILTAMDAGDEPTSAPPTNVVRFPKVG